MALAQVLSQTWGNWQMNDTVRATFNISAIVLSICGALILTVGWGLQTWFSAVESRLAKLESRYEAQLELKGEMAVIKEQNREILSKLSAALKSDAPRH